MSAPRVIYTAGCYDLLHRGHLNILMASKALGDILVVGVVGDAGVKAYKGIWPQQNVELRMRAISRLGFVDVVVMQPTTDPTPILERFRPDAMTHGSDWDRLQEGHEALERLGVEWVILPHTPGISSSMLRGAGS